MGVAKAPKFAAANQFRRLCQPLLTTTATRQTLVNAGGKLFKRRFSFPKAPRTRQNRGGTQRPTRLNLPLDAS